MVTKMPPEFARAEMHIDEDDYCTEDTIAKAPTPIKKILIIAGAIVGVALIVLGMFIKKKVAT